MKRKKLKLSEEEAVKITYRQLFSGDLLRKTIMLSLLCFFLGGALIKTGLRDKVKGNNWWGFSNRKLGK